MREIKLRGKDASTGKYVYGDLVRLVIGGKVHTYIKPLDDKRIEVSPDSVKQFTGFKDCNGVEVYDSDKLVDLEVTLEDGVKREDTAQQVYWCAIDGCWKLDHTFKQDNSSGFPLASELRDFKFKVVSGNVKA